MSQSNGDLFLITASSGVQELPAILPDEGIPAPEVMKDVLGYKYEVEEWFKEFGLKSDIYRCDTTRDSTEISDIKMSNDEIKAFYTNPMEPTDFNRLSVDSVFIKNDFHRPDLRRDSNESSNQQFQTDRISNFLSNNREPGELSQLSADSVSINNDFFRCECDLIRDLTRISKRRLSTDAISEFLSHISESSDLSHLSTDSVFIRVNDTSRQIDTSEEKVQTEVIKYFGFMERLANATVNMFNKIKNYLRLKITSL